MIRYCLVGTELGWAGLAWGTGGLLRVHLPEEAPGLTRDALRSRFPQGLEAPAPEALAPVIAGMKALIAAGRADLSMAPLDLSQVPAFNAQVYAITRRIPAGETRTYGDVARLLGDLQLARAVGVALGRNPWPLIIPCHRVTAAGGALGGFSARGGARTKRALLAIEGAPPASQRDLFD